MSNLQAKGITQALLKSSNPKMNILSLEPLMIKKSELKSLGIDELIELGKKLPEFFIYRRGTVVGQAKLGQVGGKLAIVISAKERILNLDKAESKHNIIESRLAILPRGEFTVGKMIHISSASIDNIQLFVKGKLFATASLLVQDGLYYLQIKEKH